MLSRCAALLGTSPHTGPLLMPLLMAPARDLDRERRGYWGTVQLDLVSAKSSGARTGPSAHLTERVSERVRRSSQIRGTEGSIAIKGSESMLELGASSKRHEKEAPGCSVSSSDTQRQIFGWREWVSLPSLGITSIKAKLDTGAKTSALHALDLNTFLVDGQQWIRFRVHPLQKDDTTFVVCQAPLSDHRWVTNPGGMRERRYVISTSLQIGSSCWPIQLGLTDRDAMGFRMLVGREAMRGRMMVDPQASFLAGKKPARAVSRNSKVRSDNRAPRVRR